MLAANICEHRLCLTCLNHGQNSLSVVQTDEKYTEELKSFEHDKMVNVENPRTNCLTIKSGNWNPSISYESWLNSLQEGGAGAKTPAEAGGRVQPREEPVYHRLTFRGHVSPCNNISKYIFKGDKKRHNS